MVDKFKIETKLYFGYILFSQTQLEANYLLLEKNTIECADFYDITERLARSILFTRNQIIT